MIAFNRLYKHFPHQHYGKGQSHQSQDKWEFEAQLKKYIHIWQIEFFMNTVKKIGDGLKEVKTNLRFFGLS